MQNLNLTWEGIKKTRDNAKKLLDVLGESAFQEIPESIMQAGEQFGGKIVVMGGTEPGHSTDAVAALVADWVNADILINASNIDFVYDSNPKEKPDAKKIDSMSSRAS